MNFYLYILLSVLLSNSISIQRVPAKTETHNSLKVKEKEQSEEWKRAEWDKWMNKMEKELRLFDLSIDVQKKKWEKLREIEWKKWINQIENKWMHYNKNIYVEYRSEIFWNGLKWDESQWEKWIQLEGREYLVGELKNWVNEYHTSFNELIVKELEKWTSKKIKEWESKSWKIDEDNYWKRWKNKTKWPKYLYLKKWINFCTWKKRLRRETKQWLKWIKSKEDVYKNKWCDKWLEWKRNKGHDFFQWLDSFVEKWVKQKQWNVWLDEREKLIQERISSYQNRKMKEK
ncbi:tryptophan-rich protein [Plasmodium ovale]|uniref:Tryptophan-rich protein n=1 Tax=Plasmodium ovale TaxID=36330 RepID=A0A1C3KG97_PLAOA|nr:tryptophan-rich protein [Plasmodium ovale]